MLPLTMKYLIIISQPGTLGKPRINIKILNVPQIVKKIKLIIFG
jgi:hypothetical protein